MNQLQLHNKYVMASELADNSQNLNARNYYAQISALTQDKSASKQPKEAGDIDTSILFSPLVLYGSVIIFFVLFLGGLVFQIISRTLDLKRTVTTLVVAFMLVSVPLTLKTALEVTSLQSKAGPDEAPRNVEVIQINAATVKITWETDAKKSGSVRYGEKPLRESNAKSIISDLGKPVNKHILTIDNLQSGIEYEFEILSGTQWYILFLLDFATFSKELCC